MNSPHTAHADQAAPSLFNLSDSHRAALAAGVDPLLTDEEVAPLLGVRPTTLQVWRSKRRYPLAYVRVGRLIRYRLSAVLAFIEAREVAA